MKDGIKTMYVGVGDNWRGNPDSTFVTSIIYRELKGKAEITSQIN